MLNVFFSELDSTNYLMSKRNNFTRESWLTEFLKIYNVNSRSILIFFNFTNNERWLLLNFHFFRPSENFLIPTLLMANKRSKYFKIYTMLENVNLNDWRKLQVYSILVYTVIIILNYNNIIKSIFSKNSFALK